MIVFASFWSGLDSWDGNSIPSQGSIVFLNGRKATVGLKYGPSANAAAVKNL